MKKIERHLSDLIDNLKTNKEKFRWGGLLVFVIGYIVTYKEYSHISNDFLIYNLLALTSCAILLTQLNTYNKYYSAVWLGFTIFITIYFIRFYWLTLDFNSLEAMIPPRVYSHIIEEKTFFEGFKISVISFAIFCFITAALLYVSDMKNGSNLRYVSNDAEYHWLIVKILFVIVPILIFTLSIVSHKFHIGEMGAESGEPLPFRLKGIIFYARFVMIPLMILLIINLSMRHHHMIASRLGIVLLMTHGVVEMLLRGSRGSILLVVLLLIFLVMSGGLKLYRKEKILAFIVLILGLFMVPIMTKYRHLRLNQDLSNIDAISTSLYHFAGNSWSTLLNGIEFVLLRMPGIESVSAIEAMMRTMKLEPLGMYAIEVLKSKQGIAGYLTNVLYYIPVESNSLAAPGFVGWFYLIGGIPTVITGAILLSFLVVFGSKLLNSNWLTCRPIIQTFYLWLLFVALTDGVFDSMVFMFVVGVLVLIGFEVVMKLGREIYYRYSNNN